MCDSVEGILREVVSTRQRPASALERSLPYVCLIMPYTAPSNIPRKDLRPNMKFEDLLEEAGHVMLLKEDFKLISWELRQPPYASFVYLVQFAPSCVGEKKPEAPLSGKKRRGLFVSSHDDSVITNVPN
ncbi:hypothetical protein BRADI_1g34390v3 [Brachypodium distachyon]|uniref:Uncharacterized protein n=1 Tax=Brachypodium distachyon TaxID=15368 RepID=I1GWR5_BRADI|nr:hypothetical protein BRADI_1g34390v3 [Brachypodium distachyon]